MRCTRVKKFLPLQVAGDLRGHRDRAVTKHLTTCAACRHAAVEYDASRQLLRAGAESLPAEFDSAFYEGIRNSVLAQIKGGRTPAPPPFAAFSSFFNGRLAYAAMLALIVTAAALSLHNYTRRTNEEAGRQKMIVNVNSQLIETPAPAATSTVARRVHQDRQTPQASVDLTGGARVAKSSLAKQHTRIERSRSGAQPSLRLARNTPLLKKRNPLAPDGIRQATNPQELATGGTGGTATTALTEVSRIEIQTSDPNIRIIWLAPGIDSAPPLK